MRPRSKKSETLNPKSRISRAERDTAQSRLEDSEEVLRKSKLPIATAQAKLHEMQVYHANPR